VDWSVRDSRRKPFAGKSVQPYETGSVIIITEKSRKSLMGRVLKQERPPKEDVKKQGASFTTKKKNSLDKRSERQRPGGEDQKTGKDP